MMKILDNDRVSLLFYEEDKIIHHQIHKPMTDDEVKSMLLQGCEVLEKNGAKKWLSDDRGNGLLSDEIARWGREVWNQRMIDAGWKYWALVVPEEALGEQSNMRVIIFTLAKAGVTVKLFSSPDAALAWLKKQ